MGQFGARLPQSATTVQHWLRGGVGHMYESWTLGQCMAQGAISVQDLYIIPFVQCALSIMASLVADQVGGKRVQGTVAGEESEAPHSYQKTMNCRL